MNQDQYFQAFFELLREAKIVEHLTAEPTDEKMSYDDFRDRLCDFLPFEVFVWDSMSPMPAVSCPSHTFKRIAK